MAAGSSAREGRRRRAPAADARAGCFACVGLAKAKAKGPPKKKPGAAVGVGAACRVGASGGGGRL
jgi:hypothetical protein